MLHTLHVPHAFIIYLLASLHVVVESDAAPLQTSGRPIFYFAPLQLNRRVSGRDLRWHVGTFIPFAAIIQEPWRSRQQRRHQGPPLDGRRPCPSFSFPLARYSAMPSRRPLCSAEPRASHPPHLHLPGPLLFPLRCTPSSLLPPDPRAFR